MVAAFGAAVIGATFVEVVPSAGFVAASACYAAAAVVFARLPGVGGGLQHTTAAGWARLRRDIVDQVRAVTEDAEVRRPLLAVWTHRMLLGVGFILLVLIADSRYALEASGYALALAVTGLGAFVGTWSAPVLGRRFQSAALVPLRAGGGRLASCSSIASPPAPFRRTTSTCSRASPPPPLWPWPAAAPRSSVRRVRPAAAPICSTRSPPASGPARSAAASRVSS